MRILLAVSDRDLIMSYEKLLALDGNEIETAFDGTQVIPLLAGGRYDIAVVEEDLPRLRYVQLVPFLKREKVPTIVLLDQRVTAKHLLRPVLPNAYLSLPFLPDDLRSLISSVREYACTQEIISCGDMSVSASGFCFAGSETGLTVRELQVLQALSRKQKPEGKHVRTIVTALNEKLARLGKQTRISYVPEKGYILVMDHD